MGKRGPQPLAGSRYPSGDLKRGGTQQRLNELSRRQQEEILSVVKAQPHRRGSIDPLLGHAAGRFIKAHGLARAVYDGCEAYLNYETKYLHAIGSPRGYDNHEGGSGAGAAPEQIKNWLAKIKLVEHALKQKFGWDCYCLARRLVIEDQEVPAGNDRIMISALAEIAVALDFMDRNPHPFVD
jgi:hypothetical protein